MMKITFVKKIKMDGTPCKKCDEVAERLAADGLADKIDDTVIADERDRTSQGMRLAERYGVDRAPFFIVEEKGQEPIIYTVYLKFINEVFAKQTTEVEEAKDILTTNPDLDFL